MRKLFLSTMFIILLSGCSSLENNDKSAIDYCEIDSDCVAAQCCHPTSVVNKENAPDCEGVPCTFSCEGPLDCGAGHPVCRDNKCIIAEGSAD